ncbi:hypothetical protein L2E82_39922 [Cichorium intybus]|uniref:Uncharacterized protein n=1 Tax=Cichorium intybus TaxID=13427 RepID=A0ACB9ALA8_CICIN|nr:hypothetical protein L2E82_39922 [Cichorium intybus]
MECRGICHEQRIGDGISTKDISLEAIDGNTHGIVNPRTTKRVRLIHLRKRQTLIKKKQLADILSVLPVPMSAEGDRESLKYRWCGCECDIGSWGHEYVRNWAGEIAQDYAKRVNEEATMDDLIEFVEQIVAFHMKEI